MEGCYADRRLFDYETVSAGLCPLWRFFCVCDPAMKKPVKSAKSSGKPPAKQQQNVFQEAWQNMQGDMDKVLPEKLKGNQGKKKFVLWLFVVELVVLGVVGKFVYEWIWG